MKRALTAIAAALTLAACGQSEMSSKEYAGAPAPSAPQAVEMEQNSYANERDQSGQLSDGLEKPSAQQYIAYSYNMGLRLPVISVDPVMQGHINACNAAGPSKCIVANSSLNKQTEDYVTGNLFLRATPDWIETFMAGVDAEAAAVKGEISYRNTSAEDLTRTILDTDARLKAQETLRGRLLNLLETRNGELADLLATERELARVNAEIDGIKSNLKVLRLRVSMSQLNVSYETKRSPVSASAFNPLGAAFGDFFYNLSSALAAVITAFAIGLPWLILIGALLAIWLRLIWPRIRRKKT
jgi:hypothetical protein